MREDIRRGRRMRKNRWVSVIAGSMLLICGWDIVRCWWFAETVSKVENTFKVGTLALFVLAWFFQYIATEKCEHLREEASVEEAEG